MEKIIEVAVVQHVSVSEEATEQEIEEMLSALFPNQDYIWTKDGSVLENI